MLLKSDQQGSAHIVLLFVAAIGLLAFIFIASSVSFKDGLYSTLFPKPASHAAPPNIDVPQASFVLDLEANPDAPYPVEVSPASVPVGGKFRVDVYARSDKEAANLFVAKLQFNPQDITVDSIITRDNSLVNDANIGNWEESSFDNATGNISLVGSVKAEGGLQTQIGQNYLFSTIIFTAKQAANTSISFTNQSGIFKARGDHSSVLEMDKTVSLPIKIENTPVAAPETANPPSQSATTPIGCQDLTLTGATQTNTAQGAGYVINGGTSATLTNNLSGVTTTWKVNSGNLNNTQGSSVIWNVPSVTESTNATITAEIVKGSQSQSCNVNVSVVAPVPVVATTPVSAPVTQPVRNGDINGDGKWDYVDFSAFIADFGKIGPNIEADLNGDGRVSVVDYSKLISIFSAKGLITSVVSGQNGSVPRATNNIGVCQFIKSWGNSDGGNLFTFSRNGIAVDGSGNVYIVDITNHDDRKGNSNIIQKFDQNGNLITKWGGNAGVLGNGNDRFNEPGALAIDSKGNIYVTDLGDALVKKFNSNGVFVTKWGGYGTGNGQFTYPQGIAVDNQDNVYVTDPGSPSIQKFDTNGKFISRISKLTFESGADPRGIVLDKQGNILTISPSFNLIHKFNQRGSLIGKFASSLYGAFALVVDEQGNLYNLSSDNLINKLSPADGKVIASIGDKGGTDKFKNASGLAIDGQDNLYVLSNNQVQKLHCVSN